ncbi:NEL-type E3 ubiquitin ligase domain-containing protein [Enterobacter asburiae]|jgi:Leucine-rich repeat (LRR) protein
MFPVSNNTSFTLQTNSSYAEDRISSGSLSQAKSAPLRPDEYYTIWSEWEKNVQPGGSEERDVAVARMRECLEKNAVELDLTFLGLSSLPEFLPEHIDSLRTHNNKLTSLPARLPENLRFLSVSDNSLFALPDTLPKNLTRLGIANNYLQSLPGSLPDSVEYINAFNNNLEEIPNRLPSSLKNADFGKNNIVGLDVNLPDGLTELRLGNNRLSRLPDNLPVSLEYIDLYHNNLQTLPEAIAHLSSAAEIDVEDNPLSEQTLRQLMRMTLVSDYTGPRISFSMQADGQNFSRRPLSESVKNWFPTELTGSTWKSIEKEEDAAAFSAFLSRLEESRNTRENPAFKERIAAWLTRLAETTSLRETTFALAREATTSCEDRVTLVWNDMQKVALVHDIENGVWDNRMPELISAGREMFRLELLEQAARDKVKTLHFVDEIEVYLAYQTGLRDALKLSSAGKMMRFRDVSGVTQEDLARALCQVRETEQREFPVWLVQWAPWKTAMRRSNNVLVENIQKKQAEAFEDIHRLRVNAALKCEGLEGIPDAMVAVGKNTQDEIQRENDTELTRAFLQNRYRTLMAEKLPVQALKALTELASIATLAPALAAMAVVPESVSQAHPGSLLAGIVAQDGMAPLAEEWISLLRLLHKNNHLSNEEIISCLLPHKKNDRVKSLAHALAGAAWGSEATTKLCALLADVAGHDGKVQQEIISRLSLEQPGYGFSRLKLDQLVDFYKRAKYAHEFSRNDAATAQLKMGGLIQKQRELYKMASSGMPEPINRRSERKALSKWIATKGNWSGNFGDYAPALISRLYPNVRLKINVLNAQGEIRNSLLQGDDRIPAGTVIELNLQNDHYSPVINGEERQVPANGDCFFNSFLTALNGKEPSGEEIQQLRNRLADYIRDNDELTDFINLETISEPGFEVLYEKIKTETTSKVQISHAAMEREKTELSRIKDSARQRLDEFNTREREENKKRFDEMVSSFAGHSETQASLHSRSVQQKAAARELAQAEHALRNQGETPSWKGPVATTSVSSLTNTDKMGRTTTDEQIEQRLDALKSFRAEHEVAQIRKRLAELSAFNSDIKTAQLEQRLKNLQRNSAERSGGEKQLSPLLKKD